MTSGSESAKDTGRTSTAIEQQEPTTARQVRAPCARESSLDDVYFITRELNRTMVFRIKEKFWSWGNNFAISDDAGRPAYHVSGAVFSWGDHLSFQDPDGNELAVIKQKLLSFKPRYQIVIDGEPFAEVIKEWSWFNKTFLLDVPGPNDYKIEGSFWAHEFTFQRGGKTVASVSKKFWSWTDSYGVDIIDGEDEVAVLCACIVIDQVLHDESNN